MDTKTIAEQIAAKFNDDGQCFTAKDGRTLTEVCDEECLYRHHRSDDMRYEFSDESSIVISGGAAWDLGFPGHDRSQCYCWPAALPSGQHHPDCEDPEQVVSLQADEEFDAETFWNIVWQSSDCPIELHRLHYETAIQLQRRRAEEVMDWAARIEGFSGGPSHAPTALFLST